MQPTRALLFPPALLFAAAWLLAALHGFGEPYVGAALDRGSVAAVEPGSPAQRAGLRPGDRILPASLPLPPVGSKIGESSRIQVWRRGQTFTTELTPLRAPTPELIWRATLALAGLAMILLGLWVYRRRPQPASALFLTLSIVMAFILKPSARLPEWLPPPLGEWMLLAAQLFFPALLVHFFLLFPPGRGPAPRRRELLLVYAPPALLLAACAGLQIGAWRGLSGTERALDLVQSAAVVYFLVALLVASWIFLRVYRRTRTVVGRNRLRVAVWGTVLGFLPVAAVSVMLLWMPLSRVPWVRYAGLSLLLAPLAFADATVRHRLFDFEVVVKRSLVYSVLAAFSLSVYVLLAQVAGRWLARVTHLPDLVWPALAIFLVGLLFGPLRARLSEAADQLFLRGRFDYRAELIGLTHELAHADSTEDLLERGFARLARALDLEQLAFFETNGNGHMKLVRSLKTAEPQQLEISVPEDSVLAAAEDALPWDSDTAGASGLPERGVRTLDALGASALVPLRCEDHLQGLWVLGPRPGRAWYEPADLVLLTGLGTQCGQALSRRRTQQAAAAHAHLKRSLGVAQHLQRQLVPAHTPIYPILDLASESLPCEEVGGDYYDFVPLGEERFGFVIADSTGKGVPAALLMASLRAQFHAEAPRHPEPSDLLSVLNSGVLPQGDPHRYVALFYATLDVPQRRLRYTNGGHPPPLLVHADGRAERLTQGGLLLGVDPGAVYEEEVRDLARGDVLLFFTDGVLEQRREDELFGDERVERLAVRCRKQRAQRIVQRLVEEVQGFTQQPLQDDLTVVAMKFL